MRRSRPPSHPESTSSSGVHVWAGVRSQKRISRILKISMHPPQTLVMTRVEVAIPLLHSARPSSSHPPPPPPPPCHPPPPCLTHNSIKNNSSAPTIAALRSDNSNSTSFWSTRTSSRSNSRPTSPVNPTPTPHEPAPHAAAQSSNLARCNNSHAAAALFCRYIRCIFLLSSFS